MIYNQSVVYFYDKVAKKFGGYAFGNNQVNPKRIYPSQDPEEVFKSKLLALANKDKVALDVGCGDGKFAFEISQNFKHIQGIDKSMQLLKIANTKKLSLKIKNVDFQMEDAHHLTFSDNSFDIVFSRRGPSFYGECFRVLRKGGFYLEIGIGEQDCVEIKKVFGRGQNYGEWDHPRLIKDSAELKKIGFNLIYAKDFIYSEYFQSINMLDKFLQGVPLFEDYDVKKDRQILRKYCAKIRTKQGVLLLRHRVVYIASK